VAIKISEKDAQKLGLSGHSMKKGLLDPLLNNLGNKISNSSSSKKKTSHKAPKIARRLTNIPGPEGTGNLEFDKDGSLLNITLDLNLLPVPKERARTVRTKDDKTISFTPARTKRFTQDVSNVLLMVLKGNQPLVGPVKLTMVFRMEIPVSWPIWKKEAASLGHIAPTSRPDMDNLEKALLDALNEKAFTDDAYVVERNARKIYSNTPGISVFIERLIDKIPTSSNKKDLDLLNKELDS
jgi:Holliday junction resolvase RusA-like endonuclease